MAAQRKTITSVIWSISSKIAIFTLKFVSVPILARYLSPSELGMVASGMIVVTFLLLFAGAGLTAGLIRDAVEDRVSDDTIFLDQWPWPALLVCWCSCLRSRWHLYSARQKRRGCLQVFAPCSCFISALMWQARSYLAEWRLIAMPL